ncbi:hypothetical protein POM88_042641 [Heracleum sosnowskyi]|uniref:Letm1 RBD domain-containing protein n=1 Tax=Heracleum sosnowskyi TaxID=360622 RepID=A0AAD8M9E1_9APIA|nr:hypothetical protein POM88_042641 [Heracleum sosnowskyi]
MEQVIRNLKARTEYAKFLRDTATEMAKVAQNSQSGQIKPMAEEFLRFWVDFGVCRPVSNEEILRFVKLFSDELTLDHISSYPLFSLTGLSWRICINLCSSDQGRKGLEGEKEAIKAYGAAQEENSKDAESDADDNVSSALLNRANGILVCSENLKKKLMV